MKRLSNGFLICLVLICGAGILVGEETKPIITPPIVSGNVVASSNTLPETTIVQTTTATGEIKKKVKKEKKEKKVEGVKETK